MMQVSVGKALSKYPQKTLLLSPRCPSKHAWLHGPLYLETEGAGSHSEGGAGWGLRGSVLHVIKTQELLRSVRLVLSPCGRDRMNLYQVFSFLLSEGCVHMRVHTDSLGAWPLSNVYCM